MNGPPDLVVEDGLPLTLRRVDYVRRALGAIPLRLLPYVPSRLRAAELRRRHSTDPPEPGVVPSTRLEAAEAGGVPVVWLDRQRAAEGVLVYLHGGAYIGGPDDQQWRWLAALTRATGTAGCAVLYRMPPEHPHPAALTDAGSAVQALADAGSLVPGRWLLTGDSAGGGLAVAVAAAQRDAPAPPPAGLLLTAPWVDLTLRQAAGGTRDPVLGRRWLGVAAGLYAGDTARDDPALSPVYADLAGLAPVHLHVGTRDLLLSDARRLRDALVHAGVATTYLEQENGFHNYVMDVTSPAARHTVDAQARWVSRMLAG